MDCPRCNRPLSEFTLGGEDDSAVACSACGFVGITTSHHSEQPHPESWDVAVERVRRDSDTLAQVDRAPAEDALDVDADSDDRARIDSDRLNETVSVGVTLQQDDTPETAAGDTPRPSDRRESGNESDNGSDEKQDETERSESPRD